MARIGIFVCGRDINLPRAEWERLMWGEPPDKMGSLPMAIKILLTEQGNSAYHGLVVLGNGCIPHKNNPKEIDFTKKYLIQHLFRLEQFTWAKRISPAMFDNLDLLLNVVEISRIINGTVEEIIEAARIFSAARVNTIYMVSCASQIARATMAQIAAREAGKIPYRQRWLFVPDDMFYSGTTAADVVVVEPPHRTDDPMLHAPLRVRNAMKKLFKLSRDRQIRAFEQFDRLLNNFGG